MRLRLALVPPVLLVRLLLLLLLLLLVMLLVLPAMPAMAVVAGGVSAGAAKYALSLRRRSACSARRASCSCMATAC